MNVWIATWDVRNAGTGLEVFANQALAVNAALDYADEMSLFGAETISVDAAREQLLSDGQLAFDDAECYYVVEEHEVQGYGVDV